MPTKTVEEYMALPYRESVDPGECNGEVCFVAECADLPGCITQGKSPDEAIRNLREARKELIDTLLKRGLPIPEPQPLVAQYTIEYEPLIFAAPQRRREQDVQGRIGQVAFVH